MPSHIASLSNAHCSEPTAAATERLAFSLAGPEHQAEVIRRHSNALLQSQVV
jgi:hypothetical protein